MKKNIIISIQVFLLLVCTLFTGYFTYKILNYIFEEYKSNNLSKELINIAVIDSQIKEDTDTIYDSKNLEITGEKPIEVDFDSLKQKNQDIVGWIYLEDSLINFPVVQANDNEYYLRRLIDGSYNMTGSIFMDYRNSKELSDWNTIIYGHNMKNNTMFGSLLKYKEQSYYDKHKKMYYFTENKAYEIEILAGYIENESAKIYYSSIDDKEEILERAKRLSTFTSNVNERDDDKFITLSTCSYEYDGARYVLIGILKE